MKRSKEQCPLCSSNIEEYPIHFNTTFSMCENTQCSYPFNTNDFMKLLHTDELKSKKKQRIVKKVIETNVSSSTLHQQQKSVHGKKEDVNSSLPSSPTKQKDLSFDLALPSKTISKGAVLISSTNIAKSSNHIPLSSITRNPLRNSPIIPPSSSKAVNKYNDMNNMNNNKSDHSHNNHIYSNVRTVSPTKSKELNDVSNSTNNYTLADLEVLLNNNDDNGSLNDSGSLVVTPEDTTFNHIMDPMLWLDNIVQDQQLQQNDLKFNPLQPNQDLDILLGINSPV